MAYDVVIIGAGAAGLMCAAVAGGRGRRVLIVDHAAKIGKKIRISGGGRCNFTNLHSGPENFLSANPRFCISALRRFTPQDFIDAVTAQGIAYHEKTQGQLFCDGSARQIIDMLTDDCRAAGVTLRGGTPVTQVETTEKGYRLETGTDSIACRSLVVATGGLSIPKIGATDFGHRLARQFGLPLVAPRPGLVPLTLPDAAITGLAGVALPARVRSGRTSFTDDLLFTHRGLSGPAILQISSYWPAGTALRIDLLPGIDLFARLRSARADHPKRALIAELATTLPRRLGQFIATEIGWDGRLADLSDKKLRAVAARVNDWQITPTGTEGYNKAEVTCGGVDTAALSSKTMASTAHLDLYFIGEVVDVTGHLGGHNFQWAWASAQAAGRAV